MCDGSMDIDKQRSVKIHRPGSKGVKDKVLFALLLGVVLVVVVVIHGYALDGGLSHDDVTHESQRLFRKNSRVRNKGRLLSSSCQRMCGNMSIPFPFGLSPGCASGKFFQLECYYRQGINGTGDLEFGFWPYLVNVTTGTASGMRQNSSDNSIIPYTYYSHTFQVLTIRTNVLVIDTTRVKATACNGTYGNASILLSADGPYLFSRGNAVTAVGCGTEVSFSTDSLEATHVGNAERCGPVSCTYVGTTLGCGVYDYCTTTSDHSLGFYSAVRGKPCLKAGAGSSGTCGYASLLMPNSFRGGGTDPAEWTYGTQLLWALPSIIESTTFDDVCGISPAILTASADYACTTNAHCNSVSLPLDRSGYFCSCKTGYEGDGYRKGVGCTARGVSSKSKSKLLLYVGVPGGMLLIISACIVSAIIWRLRKQVGALRAFQQELSQRKVQPPIFSFSEIKAATRNFHTNNEIGQGGFGIVYKGILNNGSVIAVKKLKNLEQVKVLDDFLNEVVLISGIKHKNLIQLRGCCITDQERILVYDYAENGNLEQALYGRGQLESLDVNARVKICFGIARGLLFLHEEIQPSIIHRDIKPANILLDDKFNAKIADFGLARFVADNESHLHITQKAGTWGYLAPEYELSDKMDVFSFGILILEIMSGRKSVDYTLPAEASDLRLWAQRMEKSGTLLNLLPEHLRQTCDDHSDDHDSAVINLLKIGISCTNLNPENRPSMFQVLMTMGVLFVEHTSIIKRDDEGDLPTVGDTSMSIFDYASEEEGEFPLLESETPRGSSLSATLSRKLSRSGSTRELKLSHSFSVEKSNISDR